MAITITTDNGIVNGTSVEFTGLENWSAGYMYIMYSTLSAAVTMNFKCKDNTNVNNPATWYYLTKDNIGTIQNLTFDLPIGTGDVVVAIPYPESADSFAVEFISVGTGTVNVFMNVDSTYR